jgi:protein arginine kinase
MMINEEDHIRIQSVFPGFNLDNAWIRIHQLDVALSQHLDYAYSDRLGHLTACLTNVGTGIRFSVFLHLPVLVFTKEIETVFSDMIPAGITVRGFHGEGSRIIGNFFQISNQYTLGWTEQGILDRVKPLIKRFIVLERTARDRIMNNQRIIIEDKIFRALGVLSHARILSSIEFLSFLSALRLGAELNILEDINKSVFNELMVVTQPAHIQKLEGKKLNEEERDEIRARLVRDKLGLN